MDRYDVILGRNNIDYDGTALPSVEVYQSSYGKYVLYEDYARAIKWLREAMIDASDKWAHDYVIEDNAPFMPGVDVAKAFDKALEEC